MEEELGTAASRRVPQPFPLQLPPGFPPPGHLAAGGRQAPPPPLACECPANILPHSINHTHISSILLGVSKECLTSFLSMNLCPELGVPNCATTSESLDPPSYVTSPALGRPAPTGFARSRLCISLFGNLELACLATWPSHLSPTTLVAVLPVLHAWHARLTAAPTTAARTAAGCALNPEAEP